MQNISPERLTPIKHLDISVITTESLAFLYGTQTVRIRQNHNENKTRFIEGKHFFKVFGDELINLRVSLNYSQNNQVISPKTRSLILWTERGAARHAKMLETDQAWDVFEKLEDCYFRQPVAERQPFNADLYISIRNDEIVNIQAIQKGEYLMTLPRYEEMLGRQGYEIIHKKDLKEVAKKYLLEIL
jgi:hypothetical protein